MRMKKLLTFLTLLMLFFGVGWADNAVFQFNSDNYSNRELLGTRSNGSITIVGAKGTNTQYEPLFYTNGNAMRFYSGNTLTISCSEGYKITGITFTSSNSTLDNFSTTTGSYSNGIWVGNANSIVFTISAAARLTQIVVTYSGGSQTETFTISGTGNVTGGTISATQTSGITSGTSVTLTATPDSGYELTAFTVGGTDVFDDMTGPDANGAYTYDITVTGNVTVSATFTEQSSSGGSPIFYESWTNTDGSGGNNNIFNNGGQGTVYADNTGWTNTSCGGGQNCLKIGNSSGGSATTPTITGLTVGTTYTLTFRAAPWGTDGTTLDLTATGGTLSVSSVTMVASEWTTFTVTFTATATSGTIKFQPAKRAWLDDVKLEAPAVVEKAYYVTVTQATGGNIVVSPLGENVVDSGDEITVTATPAAGYELTGWNITGISETNLGTTNPLTVHATGDVTITATFSKIQYSITNVVKTNGETSGAGGGLNNFTGVSTVDGVWGAQVGDVITFTANTYQGYQMLQSGISIKDADDNDVSFTFEPNNGNLVTFTMPASNVTVTANFTTYRGTIRLAGRFNGNTGWRTGTSGPAFTYDGTNDKYTIDAYFTGEGEGNYFFITYDGNASYPSANGNWSVTNTIGTPTELSWDGNGANFAIDNGVYTIELAGDLSTIAFTKQEPTFTFSPAAGEIATGTSVSATSTLTSLVSAIKANDSGASGDVTVQVSTGGSTYSDNVTLTADATVTAKSTIGNYSETATASYTVVSSGASGDYEKVTSTDNLEDGEYLIVYEDGSVAFNGALTTLDAVSNTIDVTIANDKIVATETVDAAAFTITTSDGVSTIQSASGYYIGKTTSGNGLSASNSTAYTNTISFDENGNAVIYAEYGSYNSLYLRFNSASNQNRFRYYGSGQQAIQLYKKANSNKSKVPVITPESGNIVGYSQLVTISQENNGTIYYTYTTDGTDPTDPTEASNEYTAPFWVEVSNLGGQVKIKAVAKETGKDLSNVTGITSYLFVAPANPVFTPAAGTYTEPQSVSLSTTTEGADIYYTTTAGLTPAEIVAQGTKFENPFTVSENTTYYAVTVYHDAHADKDALTSNSVQAQYKFSEVESVDLPYSRPFTDGSFGEFTTNNNSNVTVWTLDDSYGAKGTSYNASYSPTNQAADSWLISPWINMTGAYNPTLTFNHSINKYFSNPSTQATVWIKKYGDTEWTQLSTSLDNVTSVSGWTYYNENIDLSAYVDQNQYIQVGFRYYKETSSSSGSGTWEIQNFLVASEEQPTPEFNPEGGAYLTSDYPNGLDVTLTCSDENAEIYYSTDGTNFSQYTEAINVTETTTIYAYSVINGHQSATVSASYRLAEYVVNDVVFSPASGTYKKDQTCQMFSTTTGARIYYTTDGSDPSSTNGTLYSGEIPMTAPGTYNFKAIAYIGSEASGISSASYTIEAASDTTFLLYSVDQLNNHTLDTQNNYKMVNPVQVVWMSTYQNNGYQPEYCLVRDNTGYGMIYFGKQNTNHNNFALFNMGDWISGGYSGPITNFYDPNKGLSDTHPELGSSTRTSEQIHNWSSSLYMSNSPVLPEYLTIPEILASENEGSTDYWGHYVHLRKTTIQLIASSDPGTYTTGQDKDGKWSGSITDENGNVINYYDKFYLQFDKDWTTTSNDFTGHPRRTFDVYGFVSCYLFADIHYQISPFDFAWIDKPIIDKTTGTYYEPQTVTISSPDDPTATIWYKTSDMEDFAKYIPGTTVITVNSTTTIQTYATKQSQYNDELESLMEEVTLTYEEIPVPVISPESQVLPIADGSYIDATIAFEEGVTTNAVIYYTIDGSDPKTSENVYVAGETTLHFTTTTTVRAIAAIDGIYSAEAESKTYTFVKSNGIEYTLITDETELNSNSVYVIVSKEYNMALANTQSETNREGAGVMFKENTNQTVVYGNDDVAQFTLELVDASNNIWSLHTSNGDAGYLYVGAAEDNTLLTESEKDSHGNHEAQILIDETGTDHEATIMFTYEGATNRYLRFWNRDNLFNTYRTVTNSPVYIYGVEATPLATIEKIGVTTDGENQYTIADQLIAVEYRVTADGVYLWCKDQGDVSINKTEIQEGQFDFMKEQGQQLGEWDQSNWVVLKLTASNALDLAKSAKGHYLDPASVTGFYVNDVNYMIEVNATSLSIGDEVTYTPNVYSPANFMLSNLNINGGQGGQTVGSDKYYFFMNPKVQEYCKITYAEWYASDAYFTVPYTSGFDGAFTLGGWQYNEYGSTVQDNLVDEQSYYFHAFVQRSSKTSYGPKAIDHNTTPDGAMTVYPADLKADQVITAINTVDVAGNGEVKSVKYVNVAGMVSDKPFSGVNIVVTEYTDGSRTTSKMLRK